MENELSWEEQRDEWENLMAILVSSHDRWEQVAKMLPHWKQAEPGCVRIASADMLEQLREEGDLPLERSTRAAHRSSPDAALPSERPRVRQSERRAVVRPQRPPRSVASLGTLLGFAPQTEPTEIEELSDAMDQPAPEAVTVPETGDLRVEQAAAYLSARLGWDISPAMLRNWRWRGHFPRSYKDGNARASPIYFVREELDSFVPPVAERWAVGKPKYTTEEERAAAEEAVRQRARAKRRAQPPDGYISQEEALSQLGFSRQRLHILVHRPNLGLDQRAPISAGTGRGGRAVVGKGAGLARGVGGCRVLAADARTHLYRMRVSACQSRHSGDGTGPEVVHRVRLHHRLSRHVGLRQQRRLVRPVQRDVGLCTARRCHRRLDLLRQPGFAACRGAAADGLSLSVSGDGPPVARHAEHL